MSSSATPLVSVITGVYNCDRFLAFAIESVLSQTLGDFEYFIVDDASTDATPQIAQRYAAQDHRIRFLRNEKNIGANGALNRAIQEARAPYVAVLDGDDIAYPERLEKQVAFLEKQSNIGVIGSGVHIIDERGRLISRWDRLTEPAGMKWEMLFRCGVTHSAACMRRDLLLTVGGYSSHHRYATEYELFSRLLDITQITNLPDVLVAYRRSDTQMSNKLWSIQHGEVALLQFALYRHRLGVPAPLDDIDALYRGIRGIVLEDAIRVRRAATLLKTLFLRYLEKEKPDAATEQWVRQDCAYKAFTLAHWHRALGADLYFEMVADALRVDPDLWSRQPVQACLGGDGEMKNPDDCPPLPSLVFQESREGEVQRREGRNCSMSGESPDDHRA